LLVGETQDDVVVAFEVGVSFLVAGDLLSRGVDFSVKLYDQPEITATEVRYERSDRNLTQKLQVR
jgi:hypothetical protein